MEIIGILLVIPMLCIGIIPIHSYQLTVWASEYQKYITNCIFPVLDRRPNLILFVVFLLFSKIASNALV